MVVKVIRYLFLIAIFAVGMMANVAFVSNAKDINKFEVKCKNKDYKYVIERNEKTGEYEEFCVFINGLKCKNINGVGSLESCETFDCPITPTERYGYKRSCTPVECQKDKYCPYCVQNIVLSSDWVSSDAAEIIKPNIWCSEIIYDPKTGEVIGTAEKSDEYSDLKANLDFKIPSLSDILAFAIRFFFTIAGLAALAYLLWGTFMWITSSGEKEAVQKARDKIVAALLGLVVMVAVLAVVAALEKYVFAEKVCLGLTCPLTVPSLIND